MSVLHTRQTSAMEQRQGPPFYSVPGDDTTMAPVVGARAAMLHREVASAASEQMHLEDGLSPCASPPLTSRPLPPSAPISINIDASPGTNAAMTGWESHIEHRSIHQHLEDHAPAMQAASSLQDPSWLLDERGASELKLCASACPRARWIPDRDATACQHAGCSVHFGYLNLPGLAWSARSNYSHVEERERIQSTATMSRTHTTPTSMLPPMLSPPRRDSASTISSIDSHSMLTIDSIKAVPSHRPPAPKFLMTRSMSSEPSLPSQMREYNFGRTTSSDAIIDSSGFAIPMTPSRAALKSSSQSMMSSSAGSSTRSMDGKSPLTMPRSPVKLNRRHHCRRCGACFCGEHANDYAALIHANAEQERSTSLPSSQETSSQETSPTIEKMARPKSRAPSRQATFALRDMLDHGKLLSQGTMSEAKAAGIFSGRICKECKGYYELAKARYMDSLRHCDGHDSHMPSPTLPSFACAQSPQALSPMATGTSASGLLSCTPIDDGEAREYQESKERIFREEVREAVEVLKTLRNDQSANRVVAAAVAMGPRSDGSALLRKHLSSMNSVRSSSPATNSSRGASPLPYGRADPIIVNAARSLEPLTRLGQDEEEHEHLKSSRQAGAGRSTYSHDVAQTYDRGYVMDEQRGRYSTASSTSSRQYKRPRMKTVEEQDRELELRFEAQTTIAMAVGPAPKPRSSRWTWGRPSAAQQ